MATDQPMGLMRDDHGGSISVQVIEGEVVVGIDEDAAGKTNDRPHFVGLKSGQVADLAVELLARIGPWDETRWRALGDLVRVKLANIVHAGAAAGEGAPPR